MMRFCLIASATALAFVLVAGCTQPPGPAETGKAPNTPASTTPLTLQGTAPEAQEAPQSLVGTTWKVGEYTASFQTGQDVLVKGGPISDPAGAKGTYTIQADKNIIEVTILGRTQAGTWDGTKLTMDGFEGVKQQ